ncbi:hypothetical protein ACBZ91_18625 [Vibrio natriegens]|uniref:hypothetical protein n=1 Tax=Vibrio natriegens TaxID=691 RepID=UPI0035573BF5
MPEKVEEMKALFEKDAEKYHVYPFDDRGAGRIAIAKPNPPGVDPNSTKFVYYEGATRLPETSAPKIKNRSWNLTAVQKLKALQRRALLWHLVVLQLD